VARLYASSAEGWMRTLRQWRRTLSLVTLAGALLVAAGSSARHGAVEAAGNVANRQDINPADLDTTCKPCQDFYQFATGGWRKHNPVPAAYPSWGRFNLLQERNQEALHKILEAAAKDKNAAPGSIDQKIGDFYGSCMDAKQIDAEGIQPIEPELEQIAKISDLKRLEDEVARLQSRGVGALFRFGSAQDDKNSTQVIGFAVQGGLGLPDRDYYTKQDNHSKQIREQYRKHVARMLELAGDAPQRAQAEAQTVLAIETRMARASKTRVERRDPQANYHKMGPAELRALTPEFSWQRYFQDVGSPAIREVNVGQPEFFRALNQQLTGVPLADWKTYLRWHLIHSSARALSSKFVEEDFDFYGRTLTGAKQLQPRWRRCVAATDLNLGEALGQKYVAVAFPPEAKARARQMVENLVAALRADITTLPWMSPPTRTQALAKLAAMTLKIGYPDKWRDYSAYQVVRGPYIENFERGRRFEFRRNLEQIGKPVDRTEWEMTPPTVNAYYDPNMNEIVFPAGILQPPFFDPSASDALNYGGIGSVIGHEMTHGFDDQGSQYDAQGNLRNWWTPADLKNFKERAACIEKQFDGYRVTDDLHENGKLVVGESIADLGGLTLAHLAFERTLAGKPAPPKVDGYTAEQLFFLAWARIWATNSRPQYERLMVNLDPHPLPRFRVNGPLGNMASFAEAFSCPLNSSMVRPPADRCKIW
jgi:putative endopeptidase